MGNEYVSGKILTALATTAAETGKLSDELTEMLYTLAERTYAGRSGTQWDSALEKEDAVQEALLTCLTKVHLFDPERGGAYLFFRMVIYRAYCSMLVRSQRQRRNPGTDIQDIDDEMDDLVRDNRLDMI